MVNIFSYIDKITQDACSKISLNNIDTAIERVKNEEFGDFSTNIAMKSAKILKKNPKAIANDIIENIEYDSTIIEKIDIAGPGFINFYVTKNYFYSFVEDVLNKNSSELFSFDIYNDKSFLVEFVSANPTGPLNVVSGRAAAIGEATSTLLKRGKAKRAYKEFYVNDAGNQVFLLGESVKARYAQLIGENIDFPEDGYHGEYVKDIAKSFLSEFGNNFDWKDKNNLQTFIDFALKYNINGQKEVLEKYGVNFDNWYSEKELRESGKMDEVLSQLKEKGETYEAEDALWFKATKYGDEKDRVLVTSQNKPTYFLPDIAYHKHKIDRGNDYAIGFWGPDHHGYFPRLLGALKSLGYDNDKFIFKIVQQVNLLRDGQQVKMSKRTGEIVTLQELIDEVGKDAAKYFFLERTSNSHLDFDIEIAKKTNDENPVFYIQYAHARICSILNNIDESLNSIETDFSLLTEPQEIKLIKKMFEYNIILKLAIEKLEPHRINYYLLDLASAFHNFYQHCRVITENKELSKARYRLIEATKKIIADGLSILGISAPEKM